MKRHDAVILAGATALLIAAGVDPRLPALAPTVVRYEEVREWPRLAADVQMGEAAGVAVDSRGHVFVFHRPGRGFEPSATALLPDPAVLELDPETGQVIQSWGAGLFLVPHGISIDAHDNVFLTDVGLHQVFKFSRDGRRLLTLGEARVGKWDATHFNQPTDVAIRPDGAFYVSDGYVNSRVALFDAQGAWVREWGRAGSGSGEFSNPHGLALVSRGADVIVADRQNARLQVFDRAGRFTRQWRGVREAPTTGRVFSVATDAEDALYLGIRRADYDTRHTGVVKLDRQWRIVSAIGFGQPGDPVFNAVHDVAVGADGAIYVAETRTRRVVKLRPVVSR